MTSGKRAHAVVIGGSLYPLNARPNTLISPELVLRVLYAKLRRRLAGPLLLAAAADTSTFLPALAAESGSLAIH
jgi:hypothetical protein